MGRRRRPKRDRILRAGKKRIEEEKVIVRKKLRCGRWE